MPPNQLLLEEFRIILNINNSKFSSLAQVTMHLRLLPTAHTVTPMV
jgi:hypothetical protein